MPKTTVKPSIKILFRLYFLFIFAALGMLIAFLSLHYDQLGFSGIQISTIMIAGSAVVILVAPRYGHIYDRAINKRQVLIISLVIMAFSLSSIAWLKAFVLILFAYMVYRMVMGPFYSTSENLSYAVAAKSTDKGNSSFGSIRLWGSIGYAVATLFAGWLYQSLGITYNTILFLFFTGLSVVVLLLMPDSVFEVEEEKNQENLSIPAVLKLIVSHRFLWLMVLALAISDPTQDGVRAFEPIYMQNLGLGAGFVGLANSLSAIGEVPFMMIADRVIRKVGIQKIIVAVILFDLARRLLVWFFPSGSVVFLTSIITSVSFTFRLVGTLMLVNLSLPKRVSNTAHAFIYVTMFGIGYMISNALSGFVYDRFGNREVYLVAAGICVISLLLALGAGKIEPKPDPDGARSERNL
ncbi:MAG: MFS transporter [Anaerolineaceae bacterium]|jgi:MFS family permease|nr:MFS transporter [Anaerolineaceae bacterium]MDD4043267.1 MFS transporter [Anaerolineaceae bacterium]MDD4578348.1 MFS transporter [Anaerolineaceae bacterium]